MRLGDVPGIATHLKEAARGEMRGKRTSPTIAWAGLWPVSEHLLGEGQLPAVPVGLSSYSRLNGSPIGNSRTDANPAEWPSCSTTAGGQPQVPSPLPPCASDVVMQ